MLQSHTETALPAVPPVVDRVLGLFNESCAVIVLRITQVIHNLHQASLTGVWLHISEGDT